MGTPSIETSMVKIAVESHKADHALAEALSREGETQIELLNLRKEVQQLKTRLGKYEEVKDENVREGGSAEVIPPQVVPTETFAVEPSGSNGSAVEKKASPPPTPPKSSTGKPKGPPPKAKGAESSPGPKQSATPPKPKTAVPEKAARSTGAAKKATPKR